MLIFDYISMKWSKYDITQFSLQMVLSLNYFLYQTFLYTFPFFKILFIYKNNVFEAYHS